MAWDRGQGSAVSPALLTSYIKQARTIQALFHTYSEHASSLNHIHLSACWNSLGHCARAAGRFWFKDHAKELDSLVQHTIRIVSTEDVRARQLVNIAHGAARSGKAGSMGALMKALARSIEKRLSDCNAQELANTAWAFAKAGQSDSKLFSALARVAEKRVGEFNAQELSNTVWAYATAGHSDAQLFAALAGVVQQRLGDFNAQGFANTAWAFAKAGHLDAQLFTAMARSAEQRMDHLNAQDLANTAWAFAKAGQVDGQLFTALARSIEWRINDFNAQGLANTAWAFAKAGQLDAQLFKALAKSIEWSMADFNAQDLATTTWAFAKACHVDAQLFTALARSAEQRLGDFNAQDLVNTAWGFAKIGQLDVQLFTALASSIGQRLGEFDAQHLANIAWAFAKAGHLDTKLFTALARSAERRVGDFNAPDLANIAWAFANAGQLDGKLFTALAKSVEKCVGDFSEEELENTAWAFGKAGQQGIAKRLRQQKDKDAQVSTPLAPADVSKCGRIVVAGGGIGGAAIAVALQSRGFEVVVLEADPSFDARKQGYGLTIQRVDAIQALGISLEQEDAPATSHYTFSAEGHILGVFGEVFRQRKDRRMPSTNAGPGRFVHIPRQTLRAKLVDQIRPGTIRWNSKLKKFSCRSDDDGGRGRRRRSQDEGDSNNNGVTVTLTDGTTIDAALLVGADGIFSTVRRQLSLPGDRLNYLGLIVVLGMVPTAGLVSGDGGDGGSSGEEGNSGAKVASPLAQRRIFETVDGVTRIYAMPFTSSVTMWQLSFPYAEEAAKNLVKDPAALKAEILRRCGKWHDPIPSLLRSTPLDCMSGYPVWDRDPLDPEILRAPQAESAEPKPQRRVTVLGDAAHPMCPFRAQGANQALSDGVLLAEILEDSVRRHGPHAGMDAALPLFEQKMLSRSARVVVASREKAKELHSSLAMQPARKVQRESGVDMPEIIRVLRAKGIGAHNATDPRGLDAMVAEIIDDSGLGEDAPAPHAAPKDGAPTSHTAPKESAAAEKKRRRVERFMAALDAEDEKDLDAAGAKKRRRMAKLADAKVAKEKKELAVGLDSDWYKKLMFDGYTGEQWEAWAMGGHR